MRIFAAMARVALASLALSSAADARILRIEYSRVVEVMGALNAGGFNEIGLVTEGEGPSFGAGAASNTESDGG